MEYLKSYTAKIGEGMRPDPSRDWYMLITLSGIALAGILVWSIWVFDTVVSGGVMGLEEGKAAPLFNRASIESVHRIFEERAQEEARYRTSTYRFSDPSH